jgi:hypothetical protein
MIDDSMRLQYKKNTSATQAETGKQYSRLPKKLAGNARIKANSINVNR